MTSPKQAGRGARRPNRPKAGTKPPPASPAPRKADAAAAPGQVVLAIVLGAHGVGGEVKLKLFTDDLARYRSFNGGALTLLSLRGAIARLSEVPDRTAAEALRGTALTVPRADLPPLADGEYYHADLIGLHVQTPDGAAVGRVVAVENFGAGDVIEVERPDGKTFMAPLRAEAVPEWNAERLVLDPAFAPA
jgi:16S rRNA processing protein RimM